jgi:alanyl-tRNA synthetase
MSDVVSSSEMRRLFFEFFTDRGHEKVPSAPLIPREDPTLLFTSAGMVPFKPYYVAEEPPMRRAVSVQRCLRLSDLEEVGHTPYHATFFEMLGNFSFGDYFKQQAIEWGWEFLTNVISLDPEPLWVTVYKDDDAAAEIWKTRIGFPEEKIVPLGDRDNFWGPAGDSGPCGPCSEIHYDMGPEAGCGRPSCRPGCDCDRYFEVWNLVFPQFMQNADGTREPLGRPGIDTGMGLERIVSVVQGAKSIYGTDLLTPIVSATRDLIEESTGERPPEGEPPVEQAVIADHSRSVAFAIAENILPSNEAQGYVVRRLIRRAVRRGLSLGITEPFLYRLTGVVAETMRDPHPHLVQKREHVALVVKAEEERFQETLAQGSSVFEDVVAQVTAGSSKTIPGDVAFSLYDTYGFPLDLTVEMAGERGLDVDLAGFEAAMEEQKERGRRASHFGGDAGGGAWRGQRAETRFRGYDLPCSCDSASACEKEDSLLSEAIQTKICEVRPGAEPGTLEVTMSETPFYAEAGGQVADTGRLSVGGELFEVRNAYHRDDRYLHVLSGGDAAAVAPGARAEASVDLARRRMVEKNHTATHLLQAALRGLLGDHVHQSGSWVGPDRLRFDFTHHSEVSNEERASVEDLVNAWIRADMPVAPCEMPLDQALSRGAMALFGEKYGDTVRVVSIGGGDNELSVELCGGTHVGRTGEIGAFSIVAESGIAAGVRRIEAVTGKGAVRKSRGETTLIRDLAGALRAAPAELPERARALVEELTSMRKSLEQERHRSAGSSVDAMMAGVREEAGVRMLSARTDAADIGTLRSQADRLRDLLVSGAGALGAVVDGSNVVIAVVTKDLVSEGRLRAGDLVRRMAETMGGKGGGRPHLAQAGGGDPEKLGDALDAFYAIARELMETGNDAPS